MTAPLQPPFNNDCLTPTFPSLPTIMLCSNRYPLPGSPTTCLLDTVLVPLPSFLFILAVPIALFYQRGRILPRIHSRRWLHITYLALVAASWAMTILELIRLGLENLGVGLLPVTTLCLMLAFFVLLTERKGPTRVVSMIFASYWLLLSIMFIIKSVRLHLLEKLNPTTMENSKYPSSDWFLDNVVMTALFLIFFIYECTMLILSPRHDEHGKIEVV